MPFSFAPLLRTLYPLYTPQIKDIAPPNVPQLPAVSMFSFGDCVRSLVPVEASSWIFFSLAVVVCKLPLREIGVHKGAGPLGACCCFVSSSSLSSDTMFAIY